MIVGTAGHIDHGKSALVRALTGVETDRLKEEKARGISIDLGFAYADLGGGAITGFVDVPGHERFIHTMLAGAGGIDFALLVVAADDGIMPQTREHLAILDLIGVSRGIVAITKADLAPPGRIAGLGAELRAFLAPTTLATAPVMAVSAQTGAGIPELAAALARAEAAMTARNAEGAFRLPVDRAFTLPGAGTVVTGTVVSGAVAVGDRVAIGPSGLAARVRSIHAQNRPAERGLAGQRCALNLAGEAVSKDAIARGDVVMDPAVLSPTDRIDAEIRILPSEAKAPGQWFPARFHTGAAEVGARLVPLGDPVAPGDSGPVQIVLDRPVSAAVGDRFILRDVSAQRTIGGGRILDLHAPARKRRTPERRAQLAAMGHTDPARALAALLSTPPGVVDVAAFARDRALSQGQTGAALTGAGAEVLAGHALSPATLAGLRAAAQAEIAAFHADNPELQGLGRERLRLRLTPRLPPPVFLAFLREEAAAGRLVQEGSFLRLPTHTVRLGDEEEALFAAILPALSGEGRFRPPRVRDFAAELGLDEREVRRVLKLCARLGRVDEIAHDHFFSRATTAEMAGFAADLSGPDGVQTFTAAAFRDRMDNGRKVAIQILDFFDRYGLTLRKGDLRRINSHRRDLFAAPETPPGPPEDRGRESSPVGRPDFKSGWGSEPVPGGFDSHSLPPSGPKVP